MAFSYSHLTIFLLHSFFFTLISSSITTIPIQPFNQIPHSDPYQILTHIASSSIARAHKIKNTKNSSGSVSTTPIQPYSGGYSISLSFGTPPQTIPMIMDTGSSFSWFPCTKRYICKNCSSQTNISSFIPKQSSSAKILGCMNPKCSWVHKSFDSKSSCQDCQLDKTNCTQICPPYIILYGLGSTGGVPMVETLHFNHQEMTNFVVGCSIFSSNQPAGVAGFGRGVSSIPNQMGIKKFSYCLVSHKFDNSPKTSWLKMEPFSDSGKKTENFSYTRLLNNPVQSNSALSEYYYVGLKRIEIGGKKVEVLYENLVPDTKGNGGTIVDSGSTFTYMNQAVFNAVSNAFVDQVKDYKRAKNVESLTGLTPCFDVTGRKDIRIPDLELHFKGGSKMALPLENVFIAVDDGENRAVCLAMVTDDSLLGPDLVSGPSVILGNFLMQNFEVEYDLRNERFGFRQQFCS